MKQQLMLWRFAAVIVISGVSQLTWARITGLPAAQHAGPVTYLSGGVGSDESHAIKEAMHDYPLVLEFAGKTSYGNEYLAAVPVKIVDAHGKTVLETSARGPFLLVSLPAGRYTVTASYGERTEHRSVSVSPNGHARKFFLWQM